MESFEQIVTTTMIGIMSFFGWNFDEYKHVLPDTLQEIGETLENHLPILPITVEKPVVEEPATTTSPKVVIPVTKPVEQPVVTPRPVVETPKQIPTPVTPIISPTPNPLPTTPVEIPSNNNLTSEQKVKSAVGNVFCSIIEAGRVRKITGSAVAISNNGVMLTNAHVAEYILLQNTGVLPNITCHIRSGSPAQRAYTAKVVYLPSEWVSANKDNLSYSSLSGTGENDYALIVLDEKVSGSTAPNLSFIEGDTRDISVGTDIFLAGYPAFGGNIIDNALYPVVEKSEVKDIWRLNRSDSDLMGSAPTILAVHGSSGGAAANTSGKLIGIMVATTADTYTGKPNMRLISYEYISKDIEAKTRKSLSSFIRNADKESKDFISSEGLNLARILYQNSK